MDLGEGNRERGMETAREGKETEVEGKEGAGKGEERGKRKLVGGGEFASLALGDRHPCINTR